MSIETRLLHQWDLRRAITSKGCCFYFLGLQNPDGIPAQDLVPTLTEASPCLDTRLHTKEQETCGSPGVQKNTVF